MGERVTATFEVTGWDETPLAPPADGPPITRVVVTKTFHGDVEAQSTGELLTCQAGDGRAGYVGMERVVGAVGSRRGSFVIQHGATAGEPTSAEEPGEPGESTAPVAPVAPGRVVPGSGTGDFRGLIGTVSFQHGPEGATFRIEMTFVPGD